MEKDRLVTIYGLKFKDENVYCYVGSAVNKERRLKAHIKGLRNWTHCNQRLVSYCSKRDLDQLESVTIALTTETFRLITEYKWINRLHSQGHPLLNIIKSPEQDKHFIRNKSIDSQLCHTAFSILKFNQLIPTTNLWIDVLNTKRKMFDVATRFALNPNTIEHMRDIVSDLQIPQEFTCYDG